MGKSEIEYLPPELKSRFIFGSILGFLSIIAILSGGFLFKLLLLCVTIFATMEILFPIAKKSDDEFLKFSSDVSTYKNPLFLCFAAVLLPTLSMFFLNSYYSRLSYLLLIILSIWSYDTAAYFCGKIFKGPKLIPSVSPSKTWSGLVGGVLVSSIVAFFLMQFGGSRLNIVIEILISLLMPLLSQAGDLAESKFKRIYNIKDSSDLIPGHGGILDRVDGFLFTAPFVAIIAFLSGGFFA